MKRELDLPKEKAQFNLIKGAEGCWRWEKRAKTGGHVILIRSDLNFPWRQKKPSAALNEVDFSDFVSLDASFDSVSPTLVSFAATFILQSTLSETHSLMGYYCWCLYASTARRNWFKRQSVVKLAECSCRK